MGLFLSEVSLIALIVLQVTRKFLLLGKGNLIFLPLFLYITAIYHLIFLHLIDNIVVGQHTLCIPASYPTLWAFAWKKLACEFTTSVATAKTVERSSKGTCECSVEWDHQSWFLDLQFVRIFRISQMSDGTCFRMQSSDQLKRLTFWLLLPLLLYNAVCYIW